MNNLSGPLRPDSSLSSSTANTHSLPPANDAATDLATKTLHNSHETDDVPPKPLHVNSGEKISPKMWNKVKYQALKLWASVSATGKMKYDEYVKAQLESNAAISSQHTQFLSKKHAYTPNVVNAPEYMKIDKQAYISPKKLERPFAEHKEAAQHGIKRKHLFENVADTKIADVGTMRAYKFESGQPQAGAVLPTSYWLGDPEASNHLMNVYVIRPDGEKTAVIRSSVIDTKEKADEFVALLAKICEDIRLESGDEKFKLRVVSEQFNSFDFGRESKLIDNQHLWLAYANERLKEDGLGELTHISIPANTFYFISKKLEKSGLLGKFLEKHTVNGEIRSQTQNLDSWGTYVQWTNQNLKERMAALLAAPSDLANATVGRSSTLAVEVSDYNSLAETTSNNNSTIQEGISEKLTEKQKIKDDIIKLRKKFKEANKVEDFERMEEIAKAIKDAKNEIKKLEKEISASRTALRSQLNKQHTALVRLSGQLDTLLQATTLSDAERDNLLAAKRPLILMSQLLESQLRINPSGASREREFLLLQALNDELGIVSAGNCKGGIDRTAFWHAIVLATKKMKAQHTDPFQMTQEWDRITQELNIKVTEMGPEPFANWLATDDGKDVEQKRMFREVIEFRKTVLDGLMMVGLPITERSTGLQGFKWAPGGYKENKMPLNFLPSHVEMDGKRVPLVKYGSRGQTKGLTVEGRQILTKFQGMRGS